MIRGTLAFDSGRDLAEDTGTIDNVDRDFAAEPARESRETVGAHRGGGEPIRTDNLAVSRRRFIDLPDEPMRRLNPKPIEAVLPELVGVGRKKNLASWSCDLDGGFHESPLIDME